MWRWTRSTASGLAPTGRKVSSRFENASEKSGAFQITLSFLARFGSIAAISPAVR